MIGMKEDSCVKGKVILWRDAMTKMTNTVLPIKEALLAKYTMICQWMLWLDCVLNKYHTKIFWCLALIYRIASDVLYVWGTSVYYDYSGLTYTPSAWKYLLSWVLFFVMFAYMPKEEGKIGSFLLHVQFVYTVCPLLTYFGLAGASTVYMLMVFACIMLETWIVRGAAKRVRPLHIKGIRNYVTVTLGILTVFTLVVPVLYNGFAGFKAFDFQYVYHIRENATYPAGFGYIFNWIAKTVVPFGLIYCVKQKKYRLAVLLGIVQVVMYMESGEKMILLLLFPLLTVYFFAKCKHLTKMMYAGLTILYLLVLLMARMDGSQGTSNSLGMLAISLVGQRAIYGPAMTKFHYYALFRDFPKIFFSDGQIGKMLGLTYPYAAGSGKIIYAYEGGEFLASNSITGYLAESYAQMGFPGMLLMSLLFGWILRGLSCYREKEIFPLLAALFTIYVVSLNDAPLFTMLFSGGMLVSYLLVFIYLSKHSEENKNGIQRC